LFIMQVRVLPFGVLKDSLGPEPFALDIPRGATVSDLLARLGVEAPAIESLGIAVSVNAEYAERSRVLGENDEIGLLPPVSGGASKTAGRVK
jgi:molybdopterin converting factor small subunit